MGTAFSRLPAEPTRDPAWIVVDEGFQLAREHELESLFALGNGYAGTRGSLAEGSRLSAPATYVAGVFEKPTGSNVPTLAHVADWTLLAANVDGRAVAVDAERAIVHRRVLDMRQAMLFREWRQRDAEGRITTILGLRLLSLADRHVFLQSVVFVPENYSGTASVNASLAEGRVVGPFTVREHAPAGSGVELTLCAATRIDGELVPGGKWETELVLGQARRLDRFVVVHTSRDPQGASADGAMRHLHDVVDAGIDAAVESHRRAWAERWAACDVAIEGDPSAQRAVRFASYHLVSSANPDDSRVSIGARGLTGDAYKGHVFWDTEAYMLPFFTFTDPPSARALLAYRHRTLPAARERAARAGCRGALYAWESAITGEDVTPSLMIGPDGEVIRLHVGEREQHISADVAWAVWNYWEATGDEAFLMQEGAAILVETARFWASRARREGDGRYHIRGVIGPDEYHESVDDNAYTNVLSQWNLERAAELVRSMGERFPDRAEELGAKLHLAPDEAEHWERVAAAMYTGFDPVTGLFEQFQGYFELEDVDLEALEPRTASVEILLGRERLQRSKVLKQADVVMLLHLLWDRFPPSVREANFRYYEPRCAHGSSLSPAIHAAVAARLGDSALAERYFVQAAEIDLANNMGNAAGGVHVGALGALWQAIAYGFAGMEATPGPASLGFRPRLPLAWSSLRLALSFQGRRFVAALGPSDGDARLEEVGS